MTCAKKLLRASFFRLGVQDWPKLRCEKGRQDQCECDILFVVLTKRGLFYFPKLEVSHVFIADLSFLSVVNFCCQCGVVALSYNRAVKANNLSPAARKE